VTGSLASYVEIPIKITSKPAPPAIRRIFVRLLFFGGGFDPAPVIRDLTEEVGLSCTSKGGVTLGSSIARMSFGGEASGALMAGGVIIVEAGAMVSAVMIAGVLFASGGCVPELVSPVCRTVVAGRLTVEVCCSRNCGTGPSAVANITGTSADCASLVSKDAASLFTCTAPIVESSVTVVVENCSGVVVRRPASLDLTDFGWIAGGSFCGEDETPSCPPTGAAIALRLGVVMSSGEAIASCSCTIINY